MKIVCFILCLFLVSSCVRESDYEVNTSLEPYLNTFVEEAQKRGFDYSPMVEGLVMEFADLDLAAGLFAGNVSTINEMCKGTIRLSGMISMLDNVNRILDRVSVYLG